MSQINTLIKEKVVMKNVYFSTAHEAAKHIVQLLKDSAPSHNHFLIEVSFDQYEQVLEQVEVLFTMQTSINFDLKKGAFTYAQVRHIAEACCIHELHLLESGEITLDTTVLCMSSVIAFAQSKWNGADHQTAIKNAIYTAITIFGELFAEEVILQQLNELDQGKRFVASSVKSAVEKNGAKVIVKKMASKLTNRAMVSSAIAKKTCMVVNANVITGALVTGILSSGDIIRILKGEFSPILKNITKTTASIVGGIIGMLVFGSIGLYIPSVSTAIISLIGGIIGLVLGSILMTKIIIKMLNSFIQEDVINMLEIFRNVFIEQSKQYLLNEEELHQAIEDFNARPQMMKVELRDMYSKDHRERYAQNIIDLEIARIVKHRMYLHIPSDTEIYEVLEHI